MVDLTHFSFNLQEPWTALKQTCIYVVHLTNKLISYVNTIIPKLKYCHLPQTTRRLKTNYS